MEKKTTHINGKKGKNIKFKWLSLHNENIVLRPFHGYVYGLCVVPRSYCLSQYTLPRTTYRKLARI